jgi:hypothetical protein
LAALPSQRKTGRCRLVGQRHLKAENSIWRTAISKTQALSQSTNSNSRSGAAQATDLHGVALKHPIGISDDRRQGDRRLLEGHRQPLAKAVPPRPAGRVPSQSS